MSDTDMTADLPTEPDDWTLHWSDAAAAEYPGDEHEQYPLRTAFGRGVKWERKRAGMSTGLEPEQQHHHREDTGR